MRRDLDEHCPSCDSPDPARHPAMQLEGEVQPCGDPWHDPLPPEIAAIATPPHEVSTVAGTASASAPSLSAQGATLAGAVPGVAGTSTPPNGEVSQGSRRPRLDAPEASRISAGVTWN
jgi:hypothetical protein